MPPSCIGVQPMGGGRALLGCDPMKRPLPPAQRKLLVAGGCTAQGLVPSGGAVGGGRDAQAEAGAVAAAQDHGALPARPHAVPGPCLRTSPPSTRTARSFPCRNSRAQQ